jgi:hypothetical protein
MRRTIAGTALSLLAALAIGGPMAMAGHAGPATLQCAGPDTPECALLDDLAAQLGPVAPLLGTALAPLTGDAQALAARSEQPAGVPTAEVVEVSEALLSQLGALPAPVQTLIGGTQLGALTETLQALVAELTAPVTGPPQQSAGGSTATPATTASSASAPVGSPRATESSRAVGGSAAPGGSTSSAAVPSVPVGDPLALAPLSLPDFGFDPSFAPAADVDVATPSDALEATAAGALGGGGRGAELAVVAVLSALLLAGAGVAQLQANRHRIEG